LNPQVNSEVEAGKLESGKR